MLSPVPKARALTDDVELFWSAPVGCPSQARAELLLQELVTPAVLARAKRSLRVRISQGAGQMFEAKVLIRGETGDISRAISGASCGGVAEAALLVIAVALDPKGLTSNIEPASLTPPAERTGKYDPPSGGTHPTLGFGLLGDVGSLPGPSVGLGLQAGVVRSPLRVSLALAAWWPRETREGAAAAQGSMGLFTTTLHGCVDLVQRPLRFGPCAAVEVGAATGRGTAVREPAMKAGLWGAWLAGVSLGPPADKDRRFSPYLGLALGLPWARPSFEVEGYGRVFRASPWTARLSIALEHDFW